MKDSSVIILGIKMDFPYSLSLEDFYQLRYEISSRFGDDYDVIELDLDRKSFCIGLILFSSTENDFLDLDKFYLSIGESLRQQVRRDLKMIFDKDVPRPKIYVLSC